jgi:hypothetical protein
MSAMDQRLVQAALQGVAASAAQPHASADHILVNLADVGPDSNGVQVHCPPRGGSALALQHRGSAG